MLLKTCLGLRNKKKFPGFHFFSLTHYKINTGYARIYKTRPPTRIRAAAIAECLDPLNISIKRQLCPENGLSIYLQML